MDGSEVNIYVSHESFIRNWNTIRKWLQDEHSIALAYATVRATNERTLEYLLSNEGTPATFEVRINAWDPEPVANPVPSTLVDPPFPSHPADWCDGTAESPTVPSGEAWCLVTQSTSTYGPDGDGSSPENPDWVPNSDGQLMQVSETFLIIGDAGCRR